MGKTLLLTDWLVIATAGPTVDGREIKESWLTDIAETYDREEYPAFLNVEHWGGNLGMVWEVRTRKDARGRTALEAKIRPNKYYLQQNAEDFRLCFSIELVENFAGTGRAYLTGLATTDRPASLGTTAARFSCRGDAVKLDLTPSPAIQENGIVCAVKTALTDFFKPQNKEHEMEKNEMAELLTSALSPLQASLTELKNLRAAPCTSCPAPAPQSRPSGFCVQQYVPNTTVEFIDVSFDEYSEKFSQVLASGEGVDLAWTGWLINKPQNIADGNLMPLDDLIAEYGQGIVDVLGENVVEVHRNADGNIYYLPSWQGLCGERRGWLVVTEIAELAGDQIGGACTNCAKPGGRGA